MPVFAVMGEDDVRLHALLLQRLKGLFDLRPLIRKEAVAERMDRTELSAGSFEELLSARLGFGATGPRAAKDDPMHFHVGKLRHELEHRAAAADLDIVGVRAEAEHLPHHWEKDV